MTTISSQQEQQQNYLADQKQSLEPQQQQQQLPIQQQQLYYLPDQTQSLEPQQQQLPIQQQQQQPGAQIQQPQMQQSPVFIPRPVIFKDFPVRMKCEHCLADMTTSLDYKAGILTWFSIGGIFILGAPCGCFLGCCLIPLCVNSLKDVHHSCSSCNLVVGIYRRN